MDISAYGRSQAPGRDTVFEEIAQAQCHFHGSVFVTIHAGVFLESEYPRICFPPTQKYPDIRKPHQTT